MISDDTRERCHVVTNRNPNAPRFMIEIAYDICSECTIPRCAMQRSIAWFRNPLPLDAPGGRYAIRRGGSRTIELAPGSVRCARRFASTTRSVAPYLTCVACAWQRVSVSAWFECKRGKCTRPECISALDTTLRTRARRSMAHLQSRKLGWLAPHPHHDAAVTCRDRVPRTVPHCTVDRSSSSGEFLSIHP